GKGDDKDLEDEGATERAQASKPPARGPHGGALHASRPRLLGRCRRHQAGFGGLLSFGLGLDGPAPRKPAARAAALSRWNERPVLLPKTRLGRPQREKSSHRDRPQGTADHRGRRPRWSALAGAGGRARTACARLDDRASGRLRPYRLRYRSRRRRRKGGPRPGPRRTPPAPAP